MIVEWKRNLVAHRLSVMGIVKLNHWYSETYIRLQQSKTNSMLYVATNQRRNCQIHTTGKINSPLGISHFPRFWPALEGIRLLVDEHPTLFKRMGGLLLRRNVADANIRSPLPRRLAIAPSTSRSSQVMPKLGPKATLLAADRCAPKWFKILLSTDVCSDAAGAAGSAGLGSPPMRNGCSSFWVGPAAKFLAVCIRVAWSLWKMRRHQRSNKQRERKLELPCDSCFKWTAGQAAPEVSIEWSRWYWENSLQCVISFLFRNTTDSRDSYRHCKRFKHQGILQVVLLHRLLDW